MDRLLEQINDPADLRRLEADRLPQLARELREFIISSVSRTGGHLSSNLGTVELAIALHYIFDTPRDRLVWDVGHQTYAAQDSHRPPRRHGQATPMGRNRRLPAPRRERVRHLRHRSLIDVDFGGARYGGCRPAQGREAFGRSQ